VYKKIKGLFLLTTFSLKRYFGAYPRLFLGGAQNPVFPFFTIAQAPLARS